MDRRRAEALDGVGSLVEWIGRNGVRGKDTRQTQRGEIAVPTKKLRYFSRKVVPQEARARAALGFRRLQLHPKIGYTKNLET